MYFLISREFRHFGDIFNYIRSRILLCPIVNKTEHGSAWTVSCREVLYSAKWDLSFVQCSFLKAEVYCNQILMMFQTFPFSYERDNRKVRLISNSDINKRLIFCYGYMVVLVQCKRGLRAHSHAKETEQNRKERYRTAPGNNRTFAGVCTRKMESVPFRSEQCKTLKNET